MTAGEFAEESKYRARAAKVAKLVDVAINYNVPAALLAAAGDGKVAPEVVNVRHHLARAANVLTPSETSWHQVCLQLAAAEAAARDAAALEVGAVALVLSALEADVLAEVLDKAMASGASPELLAPVAERVRVARERQS